MCEIPSIQGLCKEVGNLQGMDEVRGGLAAGIADQWIYFLRDEASRSSRQVSALDIELLY